MKTIEEMLQEILSGQKETNERLTSIEKRLDSLEVKVDSLEAKVDSLEAKVDSLEAKVDSLEAKVDSLEVKVDSLDVKVDATWQAVNELREELKDTTQTTNFLAEDMYKLTKRSRYRDRIEKVNEQISSYHPAE